MLFFGEEHDIGMANNKKYMTALKIHAKCQKLFASHHSAPINLLLLVYCTRFSGENLFRIWWIIIFWGIKRDYYYQTGSVHDLLLNAAVEN